MFVCLLAGRGANDCKVKIRAGKRCGENKEAQRNRKGKDLRKEKEVEYAAKSKVNSSPTPVIVIMLDI